MMGLLLWGQERVGVGGGGGDKVCFERDLFKQSWSMTARIVPMRTSRSFIHLIRPGCRMNWIKWERGVRPPQLV